MSLPVKTISDTSTLIADEAGNCTHALRYFGTNSFSMTYENAQELTQLLECLSTA